jgi:uncharacterized protein (DUF433 family)
MSYESRLLKRITVDPKIFDGKPIIRGRRLAVEHVLSLMASGDSAEDIVSHYDWLEPDDICACLVFAKRIVTYKHDYDQLAPLVMDPLDEWELRWKKSVVSLIPTSVAGQWKSHGPTSIGGPIAAGWSKQNDLVLISFQGYSITEPITGEKIRPESGDFDETDALFRENDLRFYVPELDEEISVFGFKAGDGIGRTDDGWSLKIVYPNWPRAKVILSHRDLKGNTLEEYALKEEYEVEWLKCGFSPNGRSLIIFGGCDYSIFYR